jgi:hypothetical protein
VIWFATVPFVANCFKLFIAILDWLNGKRCVRGGEGNRVLRVWRCCFDGKCIESFYVLHCKIYMYLWVDLSENAYAEQTAASVT